MASDCTRKERIASARKAKPADQKLRTFWASSVAAFFIIGAMPAMAQQIDVWAWYPNFNIDIMQRAGKRYQKIKPGVTFNIVDFGKSAVEQKVQTSLTAQSYDLLPDVFLMEDYVAQRYLQAFPGAFAPIDGVVDLSKFAPYKGKLSTVDEKTYGVPFDSGVAGFFYRYDILAKAGFKPEHLEGITWSRFIEIGKEVEAKTGTKMISFDFVEPANLYRIMMQSGGEWYFNEDGSTNISQNKSLRAALETMREIRQAGIVVDANGWADWTGAIATGKVASVVTGVWITGTLKSYSDQVGNWRVAPIPRLEIEGAKSASNLGGSSWYVLANSPDRDAAIDFLNEIYAKDTEFYQEILTDKGAFGTLLAASTGPAYEKPDAFFGGEQVWLDFAKWVAEIPPVTYGTFTGEVEAAINSEISNVLAGQSIDEALKRIEEQVYYQIR